MTRNAATLTMLLCADFGGSGAKPLTGAQLHRLTSWLISRKHSPLALLEPNAKDILDGWDGVDKKVDAGRILSLLRRGVKMALKIEKWERGGIWHIARAEKNYPKRLKKRLGVNAPPVVFGAGNKDLLRMGGLAVVGSRDADEKSLVRARLIGKAMADKGHTVISGGARGIDMNALMACHNHGGACISVAYCDLIGQMCRNPFREMIMSGRTALISVDSPDAEFEKWKPMARNRYIYCLSNAAAVLHSAKGRGGTWGGAVENKGAGWVPMHADGNSEGCVELRDRYYVPAVPEDLGGWNPIRHVD